MHLLLLVVGASTSLAQNQGTVTLDPEDKIQTMLTPEQVAELKTEVQSMRANLLNLIEKINGLSLEESKKTLLEGIQNAVVTSNGKISETLSRYVLNRTLKILAIMEDGAHPLLDQEVALLLRSAKLAAGYAETDFTLLEHPESNQGIPYAQFGVDFTEFLMGVNESTLAPKRQLLIGTYALALFRKDLSEDARQNEYLDSISILSGLVDHLPEDGTGRGTDVQAMQFYKTVRTTYRRSVEELSSSSLIASHLSGMSQIVIGQRHSCAIVKGYAFCWGENDYGQLGDGTITPSRAPVQVQGLRDVTAIALGERHTCAIAQSEVYCWGMESVEISPSMSHFATHSVPYHIAGLSGATAISAIADHTCAVAAGQAYCWGENFYDAFPNPRSHYELNHDSNTPVLFPGAKNVTSLAVGLDHTCVLANDRILCAGNPLYGGVGNGMRGHGETVDKKGIHPIGVGKSDMIAEFANQTCASSEGHIFCWGNGIYTPIVVADSTSQVQSPLAMNFHCTSYNGMKMCWEQNRYRSTSAWRMSNDEINAIDSIQALELGVGYVSAVTASPYGNCAVINLASGNQQLFCSQTDGSLSRITTFDRLKIKEAEMPVATQTEVGPDPRTLSREDQEDLADFNWYLSNFKYSDPVQLRQIFDSLPPSQRKGIRAQRKEEDKIRKYLNNEKDGRGESYMHPVKCGTKRVIKGLLLGPFAGSNDC